MGSLETQIKKGYEEYCEDKQIEGMGVYELEGAVAAAQELSDEYDVGIEIASDGLYLGYLFNLYDLPIKTVDMNRKGMGATWQPIDHISSEDVKDKSILFFDNDVVTGRTMRRAVREIKTFSPKYMDLLLVWETTLLPVETYMRYSKNHNLPSVQASFNYHVEDVIETPHGINVVHRRDHEMFDRTLHLPNGRYLSLNTRYNVPGEIRRTLTVEKDFENSLPNKENLRMRLEGN